MLKNLLTKKLYQLKILILTSLLVFSFSNEVYSQTTCSNDNNNFCRQKGCSGSQLENKFHFIILDNNSNITGWGKYDTKSQCETNLRENACNKAISEIGNCMPDSWYNTGWPLTLQQNQAYCNGKNFPISSNNIDTLKNKGNYPNLFSNLLGNDWDTDWDTKKTQLYGVWRCNDGRLTPPATAPSPTRCDFPDYSVFSGAGGRSSCSGGNICASSNPQIIRAGSGSNSDKNFFCINDQIIMCPNSINRYADANATSGCTNFNPLAPTIPTGSNVCIVDNKDKFYKYLPPYTEITGSEISRYTDCVRRTNNSNACFTSNIGVRPERVYKCICVEQTGLLCTIGGVINQPCDPVCSFMRAGFNMQRIDPVTINSPLALIKVVVNFLFWLAVVIFIINMLSAALDYIKGGDQPDKLKEASDRITGTIFGFVFLLVASGVINYIIERVTEFIP